jgi:integrase
MKARKEHKVPLGKRAIELLRALPRVAGGFHFIGSKGGESIGVNSMAVVMKSLRKSGGVTVHGFRSAFRDWAEERTAFPAIVAELALAHVVGDAVQNAYRRTVLIDPLGLPIPLKLMLPRRSASASASRALQSLIVLQIGGSCGRPSFSR